MLIIISKFVLVYDEKTKKQTLSPALTPNCRAKMSFHHLRAGMTIHLILLNVSQCYVPKMLV